MTITKLEIPIEELDNLIQTVKKLKKSRVDFYKMQEVGLDLAWLNIALKELKIKKEKLKEDFK